MSAITFELADVEQSVPARFAQQVARFPDRLAVEAGDTAWTYAQLDAHSNRLASAILARWDGRPAPIALLIDDSAWLIAAIVAVLKSGNFYLVLDPKEPLARTSLILEDARAALVVANQGTAGLAERLSDSALPVVLLEDTDAESSSAVNHRALAIGPDSLLNIVYTSGSTGRPKGVLQTHRNLLHCVYATQTRLHHRVDDRMALLSPPTVGVTAGMLFAGLLIGAAVLPFDVRRHGVNTLVEWLARERVTSSYSLPSVVRNMLRLLPPGQKLADLRMVKMGGEPVFRTDVLLFREHLPADVLIQITLGTTETYAITWWHPNIWEDPSTPVLPVGKAEMDSKVFIVDETGAPVPDGQVGEIMLQSRYLSPGYWHQPEVTQATYLEADQDERIYRTGDFGRWLPDGNLEHLGRKDFALKLSGHLVSPIEIETTIRELSSITDIAVVAHDGSDNHKRLVAYLVPRSGQPFDAGTLRTQLAGALPSYMVPSGYISLDHLPRLPNGKLDVRALGGPPLDDAVRVRPFVVPRTPFEEVLARIWCDVLAVPAVGATDEFAELGGDSLQAAHVLARASAACGVDLPFDVLIEAPTVEALAATIADRIATTLDPRELGDLLDEVEAIPNESLLP